MAADSKEAIKFLESQSAKSSSDKTNRFSESMKDNSPTATQGPSNIALNTGYVEVEVCHLSVLSMQHANAHA